MLYLSSVIWSWFFIYETSQKYGRQITNFFLCCKQKLCRKLWIGLHLFWLFCKVHTQLYPKTKRPVWSGLWSYRANQWEEKACADARSDVSNGQDETCRHALLLGLVREGQVCLSHANGKISKALKQKTKHNLLSTDLPLTVVFADQ